MKKHPLRFLGVTTMALLCFFAFTSQLFAAITVGPVVSTYTEEQGAAPGVVLKGKVTVTSESNELQFVKFQVADVYYDENNVPVVIEGNNVPNRVSLRSWIKLSLPEDPLQLAAGQTRNVTYEIHIPEDATPGSHMGAIYALGIADPREKKGEALTIQTRVAAGIVVEIPGELIKSGEITNFQVGVGKGDARSYSMQPQTFFSWPPAHFDVAYKNTGNTFYGPQLQLDVYNMWGSKVTGFSPNRMRVFPGNTMHFNDEITKGSMFWFGPYKTVLHAKDGDGKVFADKEITFWIVPWHLILLIVITLFVLYFLNKKYSQHRNEKLKKHIERALKENNVDRK